MNTAAEVQIKMRSLQNPTKAKLYMGFFKTGKGEYGEGDTFYGITVPETRAVAKECLGLSLTEIKKLLVSPVHEERLLALHVLTFQYAKATDQNKEKIYNFYLKNTKYINNWDLVDTSAHKIVGAFLVGKNTHILTVLAESKNIWERRIAIISTFAFIKDNNYKDSIHLATMLLGDSHDLLHKAVGWVLREVGKKNVSVLENFLDKHAAHMPRTMLRYAIEKFSPAKRKYYLSRS